MIKFENALPRLYMGEKEVGLYNNPELVMPCVFTTLDSRLGTFLHDLHNVVADERRLVFIDGKVLMCNHNWIRDHVHMMKAFRHWEYDLRSFLQYIIDTQTEEGFYFELIKQIDDRHWSYVNEDCYRLFPDDHVALVRLELEADIEYLVVEGCWQYYRTTGDIQCSGASSEPSRSPTRKKSPARLILRSTPSRSSMRASNSPTPSILFFTTEVYAGLRP